MSRALDCLRKVEARTESTLQKFWQPKLSLGGFRDEARRFDRKEIGHSSGQSIVVGFDAENQRTRVASVDFDSFPFLLPIHHVQIRPRSACGVLRISFGVDVVIVRPEERDYNAKVWAITSRGEVETGVRYFPPSRA